MDITKLKWIKNIKIFYPIPGKKWAADQVDTTFYLTWRNKDKKDEKNANSIPEGELIILKQLGKVTHIVKLLDKQFTYVDSNYGNEFNIARQVEVVWRTHNWDNPPSAEEFFDSKSLPSGGKAHQIARLKAFKQRWGEEGLLEFQNHIRLILER